MNDKPNSKRYSITIEDGRVTLRTSSFKAEKGSVLHSGIFSRELASSFVAASVSGALLIYFAINGGIRLVHYLIAIVVFVIILPLARVLIFKEPYLETVFDLESGTVTISLRRPLLSKKISNSLSKLQKIDISHIRIEPDNPDAIAFVEKIALQHGTVIPGFGEVKEFYNVDLVFEQDRYTILTTTESSDAESVVERLKKHINEFGDFKI